MRVLLSLLLLVAFIHSRQKQAQAKNPPTIKEIIHYHADKHGMPSTLLESIIAVESNFNPKAKRYEPHLKAHSLGLMQVMSNYWVRSSTCPFIRHKNDLLDPMLNVSCGSSILASLLDIYPSTKDALIAYNGGQGCFKNKKCLAQASAYANKVLNKL